MGKIKGIWEENVERDPELYNGYYEYDFWIQSRKDKLLERKSIITNNKEKHTMGRPKKTTKTITTHSYGTISEMATDVRGVLKSIINQDGKFTTREAGVVGKLYGEELRRLKLGIELHKINTKVTAKNVTTDEVLSLT